LGGLGLAEDVHALVHNPRRLRLDAAAPTAAGPFQLIAVDRDEQADDVLPVAQATFLEERDGLAAGVAAAAVEVVTVGDGDEVAARSKHDRCRGEHVDGVEACLRPPAVFLPRPEQKSGGKEEGDQVDAAAGMNANAW